MTPDFENVPHDDPRPQPEPVAPAEATPLPTLGEALRRPRAYARRLYADIRRDLADADTRPGAVAVLGAAALGVLFLGYFLSILFTLPSIDRLQEARFAEASVVLSADGKELARFYDKNRIWVRLDQISPHVVEALIATEDHRFYRHWGIDVQRTIGSVFRTLGGDKQGGSTITMQFARNAFPEVGDDMALTRKFKEWITALRIEGMYEKNEILEMYLNTVPMMYNTYGFEAAAQTYFQKHVRDLDVVEAAVLVGMLKGTSLYNPVRNPEASLERRNVVLGQMVRHGYLKEAEFAALKGAPTPLRFQRMTHNENKAPYFAEQVRQFVGEWAKERGVDLYTEGLRIHTTIDARLQQAADSAVSRVAYELQAVADVEWSRSRPPVYGAAAGVYRQMRTRVTPFAYFWEKNPEVLQTYIERSDRFKALADSVGEARALATLRADAAFVDSVKQAAQVLQASFVAIDPHTGHVKAWVGGRNFEEDKYDHVSVAKRQPGSTFKPFVYAAAIENGYSPDDQLLDEERAYVDRWTRKTWKPQNVGDATGRPVSLRDALALSKNTITAQLITDVGAEKVADLAHQMGIESELEAVPSLGLGTSDVSLLELATAYATLADYGTRRKPVFVTRIESRDGRELATFDTEAEEAVSPNTAYAVLDMMRGVVDYGTGIRIRSAFGASGDLAGKTGTTQNAADGWFMLIHPNLVMGSWVGFNSPSITFRSDYWGQGAHTALYVVGNFVKEARLPAAAFRPPAGYAVPPPRRRSVQYVDSRAAADTVTTPAYAAGAALPGLTGTPSSGADDAPVEDEPIPVPDEEPQEQPADGPAPEPAADDTESLNRAAREASKVGDYLKELRKRGGGEEKEER